MIAIKQIAYDVFRENIRHQLFHLTFFLCLGLVFLFTGLSTIEEGLRARIFNEVSVTLLWFMHFLLTIFLVVEVMFNDIEAKNIYFYLVRNVSRLEYLIGKYLGFLLSIGLSIFLSGLVVLICAYFLNNSLDSKLVYALYFLVLEIALSIAVLMFLSLIFSKLISVSLFVFLFFLASLLEFIVIDNTFSELISYFIFALPNFKYYSWFEMVIHAKVISLKYIWFLSAYTGSMSLFYLLLAHAQFKTKEL